MRPFFPYYGSKWNIIKHYPEPAHERIVEPFAGSASYATWHNAEQALLIDSDPVIAGLWHYLINVEPDEIAALPELPNAGDTVDDHELRDEAKWLIGFWLNRGSATPKRTRTAYSARTDRAQLNWGPRAKDRIIEQLPRIQGWVSICGDYRTASAHDRPASYFIDPPYGLKGRYYRHGFSKFDELGEWVRQLPGQVIVCEGAGARWLPFESLGHFKTSKGIAHEQVWVNA